MFKRENNQKIGAHIADLIQKKYPSKRQFCRAYLTVVGEEINDVSMQNMANRLSQIIKGTKAIQTYDLPFFTELLGVSCEQILSAGEYSVPQAKRVTNYYIAFSKDPDEWEAFINREDKLILNQDEYCKTILDYAVEFGNYDLLKYLIDKKYIWFDGRNENDYILNFGAGTSIKHRHIDICDWGLEAKMRQEDELRWNLITLAADHNDMDMLEELRARENPQMYSLSHYISKNHPKFYESYNERMVRHIAKSSNEVLDYFTDEIEIRDRIRYSDGRDSKHIYMFPYISELLDFIIEENSPFAEIAIKKAIRHNKSIYEKIVKLIKALKNDEFYAQDYMQDLWKKHCEEDFVFSEDNNTVSFYGSYSHPIYKAIPNGLITNIAHITKKSKDPIIKYLIEELNETYVNIKTLKEQLGAF